MKRRLNKWLSGILAACVLFTTVPVYAINDVSGTAKMELPLAIFL